MISNGPDASSLNEIADNVSTAAGLAAALTQRRSDYIPVIHLGPQESSGRKLVNVYVAPCSPMIVIGPITFNCPTHAHLDKELKIHLKSKGIILDRPLPDAGGYVSGFADGPDLIVRIDEPIYRPESGIKYTELLQAHLNKYKNAIEVADKAALAAGGRAIVQCTSDNLPIAKTLGELHRVLPVASFSYEDARKFIESITYELKLGHYYYAPWGTRLFSADQINDTLSHVDQRNEFLAHMDAMLELMHKDARSKTANVPEGRFLIVDAQSGGLDTSHGTQEQLYDDLKAKVEFFHTIGETEWRSGGVEVVRKNMTAFVEEMRYRNHHDFRFDNLDDSSFVLKLAAILRENKGQALGEKFSTPLKAVGVGRISYLPDGTMGFIFSENANAEHRALVKNFIERCNAQGIKLNWLNICEPLTQLTPEYHPARIAKRLGMINDESLVILAGRFVLRRDLAPDGRETYRLGSKDMDMVVRKHPFGRATWEKLFVEMNFSHDERVQRELEILRMIGSKTLAELDTKYSEAQTKLFNRLAASNDRDRHFQVPPFVGLRLKIRDRVDDRQERPFIAGDRLDYECLTSMSFEQLIKYGYFIGQLAAINFLSQRPSFSLHELLITKRDRYGDPKRMISIGTTESFSNSFGVENAQDYVEAALPLYWGKLGSLIAAMRHGRAGLAASAVGDQGEIRLRIRDLRESFRTGFVSRYEEIQSRPDFGQDEVRENYVALRDFVRKNYLTDLPEELDITKNIDLTEELLTLDPKAIADEIILSTRNEFTYSNVVEGIKREDEHGQPLDTINDHLIRAVDNIIEQHCSDYQNFPKIFEQCLGEAIDFSPFSIARRHDLLVVGNASAWIMKLQPDKFEAVFQLALSSSTAEIFVQRLKLDYDTALLNDDLARSFHNAINSIVKDINESLEGEESRILLEDALSRMTFENFPVHFGEGRLEE